MSLENNTSGLEEILATVNNLPEAGSGEPGADGFSPIVEITEISGGHNVSITDVNGEKSFDVMDGDTPVRGTDYWTDDDKAEIKSYVDEAILGGEW